MKLSVWCQQWYNFNAIKDVVFVLTYFCCSPNLNYVALVYQTNVHVDQNISKGAQFMFFLYKTFCTINKDEWK